MNEEQEKRPILDTPVLILIGVVLIAAAFVGGIYFAKMQKPAPPSPTPKDQMEEPSDQNENMEEGEVNEEEEDNEEPVVVEDENRLNIDWLPIDRQGVVAADPVLDKALMDEYDTDENLAYKLGTVNGGKYDGYDLTLQIDVFQGLGGPYGGFYYLLTDPSRVGKSVVLNRYPVGSIPFYGQYQAEANVPTRTLSDRGAMSKIGDQLIFDSGSYIPELDYTSSDLIKTDNQGHKYVRFSLDKHFSYVNFNDEEKEKGYGFDFLDAATIPGEGTIYYPVDSQPSPNMFTGNNGAYFGFREDGRLEWYDIYIPFWDENNTDQNLGYDAPFINIPDITWVDGTKNDQEYLKAAGAGCGFSTLTNVVDRDLLGDLKVAATYNVNGESGQIYEPVSLDSDYYQERLASFNTYVTKPPLEAGDVPHPLIYWQDSFDRWIEMRHVSYQPAVECGKPVIYLYPEEKTDMKVEVAPRGGFSVTIPDYNDGWEVTAYPDGTIVNHGDNEVYPYLFWEGRGGLYEAPKYYWVVEKDQVHDFLIDKLGQFGLNDQETADFLEFWEPRMQAAPYYKVGFHGTEYMNELAPLNISEQPDMLLRILMDYEELDQPIEENPPRVPRTPKRHGFSVIEWGGVLK